MSPCSTPATMSKYSVSPSGDRTFTLVFLYIYIYIYIYIEKKMYKTEKNSLIYQDFKVIFTSN